MDSVIFDYFPKKDFSAMLTAFNSCTGLLVELIDNRGIPVLTAGKAAPFCCEFMKYLPNGDSCTNEHFTASRRAIEFGETYIFCCHSGLYHIVYPLLSKDQMFGSVIAGPFLMESADADLVLDLEKHYDSIPVKSLLLLSDYSHQLQVITPEQATQISQLLYFLTNSLISGSRELQNYNREKLLQQSQINESIQMYKSSGFKEDKPYPIETENLLITKVKSGNIEEARAIFNDLLGYLFLYENHNVKNVIIRLIELCSLLSRASIDRGADIDMVLRMNDELLGSIINAESINDICFTIQDNMEIFTDSLFYVSDKNSKFIKEATKYISSHFSENITLNDLADILHLNPSYLSSLFKNTTGLSYKEYLNRVRIEEAKRLLSSTDYPIMEIAVACGFNDQSYFTKIFKKHTGMTPKHYR